MHFHFITIFPNMFTDYMHESVLGRATKQGVLDFSVYDVRDFAKNKWNKIDDRPYGGGPGMVMEAAPILAAVKKAIGKKDRKKIKIAIMAPRGTQFTNELARKWANKYDHVILIAGRYEGIDSRVKKILRAEEVSIGPYVVTGGELPALLIADAVARQVSGVLGKGESLEETRVSSGEMYTRPEVLEYEGKKYKVPKVLLSGDPKKIDAWKLDAEQMRNKRGNSRI
ncbi:MAG: tRNA (guanosine(37)-N1)-methyltransferase TrmD [Candidatus Yonathbacteria bacterium]|nr:tRNA (guanosine(37)-N1)-methyltransferase TrmD [Candidatus Yonathbacteria bacterium]NTW47789.1 tRNA (guanosine(37)-N1)-methyltransferase TrmD [Candidatus Yonathbacteria bacterium]